MPVIVKRPRALADIAEIWDYIADDNEERADSFVVSLDGKFQTLAKNPRLGRQRDELAENLRSWPFGRYVIFYVPLKDGVEIVRVLHGARDILPLFEEDD